MEYRYALLKKFKIQYSAIAAYTFKNNWQVSEQDVTSKISLYLFL
jgi:hypothetical protein